MSPCVLCAPGTNVTCGGDPPGLPAQLVPVGPGARYWALSPPGLEVAGTSPGVFGIWERGFMDVIQCMCPHVGTAFQTLPQVMLAVRVHRRHSEDHLPPLASLRGGCCEDSGQSRAIRASSLSLLGGPPSVHPRARTVVAHG